MSTNLSDLLAQKAALEKQIIEAQREERSGAINQIRSLMSQFGLTLADIGSKPAPARAGKPAPKVAPKYRDPASGSTWSGRGLQPKWLKAAVASGKKVTDFAI